MGIFDIQPQVNTHVGRVSVHGTQIQPKLVYEEFLARF